MDESIEVGPKSPFKINRLLISDISQEKENLNFMKIKETNVDTELQLKFEQNKSRQHSGDLKEIVGTCELTF